MVSNKQSFNVIPTPKSVRVAKGAPLQSRNNNPVFRVTFAEGSAEDAKSREIICAELVDMSGGSITNECDAPVDFSVSLVLDAKLLYPSDEAYRLVIKDSIQISARGFPGLLYATATLRQLLTRNLSGQVEFPQCEIEDYPDIEYRCAARWLVELEGTRMMFDWGDGREKMLQRYRQKIDFCMRYKINMAFFDGFEWKTDKYPEYIQDIHALNAYAAARNVYLEFGGHGIGFGGFPGHTLEGIKGLGDYNRRSYPDGEIYECGRIAGAGYDPHWPSVTSDAMRNGTCRSNEALNALKKTELANYVGKLEPGMLYIHNEDISDYHEFEQMWLNRCPDCRARWPEDDIASTRGAAGAIAHGLQCLYQGITSVKNPVTRYDGERDCQVVFASPAYGILYNDDATWNKISDFWTAISRELGHASQIMFCVREQFFQTGDGELRIKELSERLQQEGGGHGLFVFVVSGADLYANNALSVATPRLNHFYDGARAIFNFNGGIFAGPQEIYNSEYAWNLRSPYGIDVAEDYEAATDLYYRRSGCRDGKPEVIPHDALLKRACELCYGDAALDMVEFYTCYDADKNYPAALFFLLIKRLLTKDYAQHDRAHQEHQWRGIHQQTVRAIGVVDTALEHQLPRSEIREELVYLQSCLAFGKSLTKVVVEIFGATPDWRLIKEHIHELRQLVATYPRDFTSSFEGEMNLWDGYLEKLLKFISPFLVAQ